MNIYQQQILDHYHNPRNFGKPDEFDFTKQVENISCGDDITMYISLDSSESETIKSIAFTGEGCAIAIASASLLTEYLVGKPKQEVVTMTTEDLLELIGIDLTTSRLRCATLSLDAAQQSLNL